MDFTTEQKSMITVVMKNHMGDEKVLISAIEFLQNLVVSTEADDILIKKVSFLSSSQYPVLFALAHAHRSGNSEMFRRV